MTGEDDRRIAETKAGIEFAIQSWAPGKVLVLGCGDGTELLHFKERDFDPVGVTFQPVELASGAQRPVAMVNEDIHDLSAPDETFDYTYSKETLEHLLSPFIGVYQIARVMKVGGKFCHFISSGVRKQWDWYHFSCFPDYVWFDLFHKAGLVVTEVRNVIVSGDNSIQIVLTGYKERNRDLTKAEERYHLQELVHEAQRPALNLIDHRK